MTLVHQFTRSAAGFLVHTITTLDKEEAKAALVAPELLAAAKDGLFIVEGLAIMRGKEFPDFAAVAERIRAAISKATEGA